MSLPCWEHIHLFLNLFYPLFSPDSFSLPRTPFCFHEYLCKIYKIYMHSIWNICTYKYEIHALYDNLYIFIRYRFYRDILYIVILYLRKNVLHLLFSVGLISLNIMLSSPIHFNASYFVHLCSWITVLCIHTTFPFVSSFIDCHLGWFQDLCIVTSAKINRDFQYLCHKLGLIPSHIYSRAYSWIMQYFYFCDFFCRNLWTNFHSLCMNLHSH